MSPPPSDHPRAVFTRAGDGSRVHDLPWGISFPTCGVGLSPGSSPCSAGRNRLGNLFCVIGSPEPSAWRAKTVPAALRFDQYMHLNSSIILSTHALISVSRILLLIQAY